MKIPVCMCLFLWTFTMAAQGTRGGGKKPNHKRINYHKYEREEVRPFRSINSFIMPKPKLNMPVTSNPGSQSMYPIINLDHLFQKGNSIYMESDSRLFSLIKMDKHAKSHIKFMKGFRVLIYIGTKREDANATYHKALRLYPSHSSKRQFYDRKYRVKIGNFILKQDAERFRKELRAHFPAALVLPDKIPVPNLSQ